MDIILDKFLISTILILFILLINKLLENKVSPKIRIFLWVIIVIRLLSPFLPKSNLSINSMPYPQLYYKDNSLIINNESSILIEPEKNNVSHTKHNNKRDFLSNEQIELYFLKIKNIISIVIILFFTSIYIFFYKRVQIIENIDNKILLNTFEECKNNLNINRKINLKLGQNSYTFGILKQNIIISNEFNHEELKSVLYHELIHCKYYHNLWNFVGLLVVSIYWFNPIVWYGYYKFKEEIEKLCDYKVLEIYEDRYIYASALFKSTLNNNIVEIGGVSMKSNNIKERIKRISKQNTFNKLWAILGLIIILVTGVVFATDAKEDNNIILPLKDTFLDLGYDDIKWNNDNKSLELSNGKHKIKFIKGNVINKKLEEDVYFMNIINNKSYISSYVLEDLGYKINYKTLSLNNKGKSIILNSNIDNFSNPVEENELQSSFLGYGIIHHNLKKSDLRDYKIEDINQMQLKGENLKKFIKTNYNKSLDLYKNNLIAVDKKYPKANNISYIEVENGQFIANVEFENKPNIIVIGVEVRDKELYIEK